MLDRSRIEELIPHRGRMCLLDGVESWDAQTIRCWSRTHLDPHNPLRQNGRLGAACGIEYGLQAAALHGALLDGAAHAPGYLAALREVSFATACLDDPALGRIVVAATLALRDPAGLIYGFAIAGESGRVLVCGRATIVLGASG